MRVARISRNPVRLSRGNRAVIYAVGIGVWLSGVLWLVFHYFLARETPFGPAPHPLEFWWRAAHGFFAFASLWTFGLLWGLHVLGGWSSGRHRLSGGAMFVLIVWLIGSGYLLYYLSSDTLISAVSLAHWGAGLFLPVPFVWHRWRRR